MPTAGAMKPATVACALMLLSGAQAMPDFFDRIRSRTSSKPAAPPPKKSQTSIAFCKVSASSGSSSTGSASVAASAAAEATAHICGGSGVASAAAVAEATAYAAAIAIAEVSVHCYAQGKATFHANGRSAANAEAYAYAVAYASAIAESSACGKCSAAAEFVAEAWQEIFLKAVAEAEVKLSGAANGGTVEKRERDFVKDVQDATVIAYAEVLATAKASADAGCDVSILGDLVAGDIDDPSVVSCAITAVGKDNNIMTDAVAKAIAEAEAYACGTQAASKADSAATAVAEAVAHAIAEVGIGCYVEGKGVACAYGESDIETVASATAEAFARGYASAINECGKCSASVEATTEAVASVVVEAFAHAYNIVCLDSDYFYEIELVEDISHAQITAIATAIAEAIVDDDNCEGTVEIGANTHVCNDCVSKHKRCAGGSIDKVKGCCDDGYSCYKKSQHSRYGTCSRDNHRFAHRWTHLECEA